MGSIPAARHQAARRRRDARRGDENGKSGLRIRRCFAARRFRGKQRHATNNTAMGLFFAVHTIWGWLLERSGHRASQSKRRCREQAPTIRATDQLDREGAWPPNTRWLPTLVGPLAILAAHSASSLGNARSPGWCLLWRAAQHKAYEVAPYSTTMVTSVRCLYLVTHAQHVPNLRGHDSGWQSERTTLHRRTDFRPSSAHRDFRRVSGRCRSKYVLH